MAGNGGYGGAQRRGGNGGPQGGRGGGPPPVPPKGEGGPVQAFRKMLYDSMKRIEGLFPQGGPQMAKRICAMALIHYERMLQEGQDPTLDSVFQAVMRLAQYGLELVGDQAYLYSYGAKAEMVIGPGGLITLASRSGLTARADVVFEGDEFDYELGCTDMHHPGGWVKHKKGDERRPANRKETEKVVTHAYAIVLPRTIKQGEIPIPVIGVLTAEDIAYYRGFSRASKGPWFDNFEGMARKTALKRALKFAPVDMLLTWALTETDTGGAVPFIDTFGETMDEEERAARAALTEGRQSAREQLGVDDQGRDDEPAPQRQQAHQQLAQRAPDPESDGREPGPLPDVPTPQQGAFGEWTKGQGQR